MLCRMEMIAPKDYVGKLMELGQQRRGDFVDMQFLTEARTTITYDLPLAEVCLMHPAKNDPLQYAMLILLVQREQVCKKDRQVLCHISIPA